MAAEAAEQVKQEEQEEQKGVTTFKHGGDEVSDSQSDGDDGSPSKSKKCSENNDHEAFGQESDVPKKGKDAGTAKEMDELKKSPKRRKVLRRREAPGKGCQGQEVTRSLAKRRAYSG